MKRARVFWLAMLAQVALLVPCGCGWAFLVATNPILISSKRSDVRILVDGEPFVVGKDTRSLSPYRLSYLVEVVGPGVRERRRIYPWGEGSDSGAVIVDREGVGFHLKNTPEPLVKKTISHVDGG